MEQVFMFPLQQHIGMRSVPIVQKGDTVKRGQLIAAAASEALGSNIFSSVSGVVEIVTDTAIEIIASEQQSLEFIRLQSTESWDLIREAGIVGLGGAGFPTYAKLSRSFSGEGVVIANASECEPILAHNIAAIEEDAGKLVRGLEIAMDIVHAAKGIIAIKEIHEKAIRKLRDVVTDSRIVLHVLPNSYPVGEERAIVREVLGRLLETDQLPLAAAAIVINAESLCKVQEAVDDKKPFIDKDVTVAGKIKGELIQVFRNVPLGLPVRALLERAGGLQDEYGELIMGGPFMGHRTERDAPIVKTTGGIIAAETFLKGPDTIGLLVCACGGDQARLEQLAASMGSEVVAVEFCKQAKRMKNGTRKCENPGICPGQVQKVLAIKKAGAQGILISNCTDCSNTVMSCAPQLKLPVYHCTDGALRAVNHKLVRRIKT